MKDALNGKFESNFRVLDSQGTFKNILEEYENDIEEISGYLTIDKKEYRISNRACPKEGSSVDKKDCVRLPDGFEGPGYSGSMKAFMNSGLRKHSLESYYQYDFTPIGEVIELTVRGDDMEELEKDLQKISKKYFQKFKNFPQKYINEV